MARLEGKRVALAGSRKTEEISQIILNMGGTPLSRPSQGTSIMDGKALEADVRQLASGAFDWIILTTGIGTETLYQTAVKLGIESAFTEALKNANLAARGYKTVNKLKELGIVPDIRDDDGSVAGLVRALAGHDFKGKAAALQLHGDPAPALLRFLEEEGASFKEILPYKHIPPETEVLEQLVREIINGEVDAVNFTSTPQIRYLFGYAREKGLLDRLLDAFSGNVAAVAVGKVTASALREAGVERMIVPDKERMGSAIVALAHFYKNLSGEQED